MPLGSAWLTQPDRKQAQQLVDTVSGMAHFAGTGPAGATCRGCAFMQDLRKGDRLARDRCRKFFDLTGAVGERLAGGLKACKYFESKRKAVLR